MAESPQAWQTGAGTLGLEEPLFLGILNVTPDSFSDGGRFLEPGPAVAQGHALAAQGARALDLGGESTRPGAGPVSPREEWARLEPVLTGLRTALPGLPLTLDTRHAEVACHGLRLGAAAINDVTGFQDPELLHVVRNCGCGLIAMRSRLEGGELAMPPYGAGGLTTAEAAIAELACVRDRLLEAGIAPGRILLDPGFGFGTTFSEDQALWEALPRLPQALDWPVARFCLGLSRKRFLAWRALDPTLAPLDRDPHGARAHREALRLGYRVFRTHAVTLPIIREARAADALAVAQVQVASWRATYQNILPEAVLSSLSVETQTAAFRETLASPRAGNRLWVVEARGRIMGFSASGPCDGETVGGPCEVQALYLLREAWGQDLGLALMTRTLEALRQDGCSQTILWVLERNARARRFYEAGGWQLTGAPRTIWQDGIALREVQYSRPLAPWPAKL